MSRSLIFAHINTFREILPGEEWVSVLDTGVPVLLVRIGNYPLHHGSLGVVRTVGRLGVPVHAVVEDRFTPVALSRHLTSSIVWPTTGREEPERLADGLLSLGRTIGARCVAVPTDDEAAILLAEYAHRLKECFLIPAVPAHLPRLLACKASLHRICAEAGVPSPRSRAPESRDELVEAGRELGYPLALKNLAAFSRLRTPAVSGTTIVVPHERALLDRFPQAAPPPVLVQEYIPRQQAEDWITHLYCGTGGVPRVLFTGLKLRSWPPYAGMTARAVALRNPELARLAERLCRLIGYSGLADLDWRYDRRDGQYKLVDFNPRAGAQFRLFEDVHGVDVVRAMHLDLTGRPVPDGAQAEGRVFVAGQLDFASAVAWLHQERRLPPDLLSEPPTERAWLCRDDPLPAAAEAVRFAALVTWRLLRPALRPGRVPLTEGSTGTPPTS
ncbi:ATP-grasp domain-containing protein [Streptomyces sp. NBC_00568]|uniref:carboxylate--amine ligase n=1 Tax=Streptomyces sp. NBC_00568 TaxID=2975779 RepID=UPI002251FDD8|nr:ATP-grasp domain-containing protein [Streptomyces sp. NBC_00568]MCX4992596.1 ATP-grasp domain-containing protein [Streptomyces sp. NBC_00568]